MDNMMNSSDEEWEDGFDVSEHFPSFFQLYHPDYNSTTLRIPKPYIENMSGMPEKISMKNSFGCVWAGKLGYVGKELHIVEGWENYAEENALELGDFVFTYLQNSCFLIKAYGANGLIKQDPLGPTESPPPKENLRFYKTFKFRNFLIVPTDVLDECVYTQPQSVMLSNDKGKGIKTLLRHTSDRVVVGYAGVAKFWRMNKVKDGDQLEFTVICENGNVIKEIVMKNISQSEFRRGV